MRSVDRSEAGEKDSKQKLPPNRWKKFDSFGREYTITGIPLVVVTVPGVHVPLAVVGVPVDVHHESALSYPKPSSAPPLESSPG